MFQTITNTAKLQCNQASLKTLLMVTSQIFGCIDGEPFAAE
ncbi:hypothetical protein ACILDU_01090 [Capnocytophaga canimorsus]|nr:hypothetical protein [Capnocytophaga canimorsus]